MFQRLRSPSNVCDALKRLNSGVYFCSEAAHPTDHNFIYFRIFRFFFINISMDLQKTQTAYVYT